MPGSPGKLVRLGVLWPPDRELEFEMAWLICKKAPGSQATLGRGARDCQKTDAWAWYHPRGPATTRSAVMVCMDLKSHCRLHSTPNWSMADLTARAKKLPQYRREFVNKPREGMVAVTTRMASATPSFFFLAWRAARGTSAHSSTVD
ncbi:hypothetical protein B2J93_3931 [Marssonina coronariae]|uniref:Uncharacterized protein n=1 Tax=Diplocarpon coronariae TaxID=2795749 RepID=A0A218YX43_9HELO|nr:hypothetical protein B2J93_3931 [Marssonina coronariae]